MQDVKELISKGESTNLEFKSWIYFTNKKSLMEELSEEVISFANCNGGQVLLGVEDDGEVTGCENYNIQTIIESIYERTRPSIFVDIEEVKHKNNKVVLIINVPKGNQMYSTSNGKLLRRLGKVNKPLSPSHFYENLEEDVSAKVIKESTYDDVNTLEIYKLKERIGARNYSSTVQNLDDVDFLKELSLIVEDNGELKLTVAGMLFMGKDKSIQKFIPQAEVIYLGYQNLKDNQYTKRLDLKTTILSTLDRITEMIENSNTITNVQVGLFRLEISDYPIKVVQEALLNAITHRNYNSLGAIYVKQYEDKLIIENPGGFLEDITPKNIITHPSVTRNKLIAETLQRIQYVQRAGQGVDLIYEQMLSWAKPMPMYTAYEDSTVLTLLNSITDEAFIKFVVLEQEKNQIILTTSEIIILYYLKDYTEATFEKLMDTIQNTEDVTKNTIKIMQNRGLVEKIGQNYILTQRVYSSLGKSTEYIKNKTINYIRAKDMILEYMKNEGYITNAICRQLCGYDNQKAKYTLKKLADENLIEKEGIGKAIKYLKK